MRLKLDSTYANHEKDILYILENFQAMGTSLLDEGDRNEIKVLELDGKNLNIKSFKIPNAVNQLVYRFFRKSKAERSFYYARHLLSLGIGTPHPIAYAEEFTAFAFKRSFYISEHLDYDLTFRELVIDPKYSRHEEILRAFTRFTFEMHEKKVQFLDHSPGNTLIRINNGNYEFFLVDLNRMLFKEMNFVERMKNFSRLTPKKEMVAVMANEYSRLIQKPESEVFEKMWFFTHQFQQKFWRKRKLKQRFKS